MKKSENKIGELNPMFVPSGIGSLRDFGRKIHSSFAKFAQPTPVYVYSNVSKELLISFPEGIVVAKNTLQIGYDTLRRLCKSNPNPLRRTYAARGKEVFTPRKGPLQNHTLIFSYIPLESI